jgi:nitrate reductase assembly molybdenum cofactor insertion protein NarJ
MNTPAKPPLTQDALDLLVQAAEWRAIELLLSRPIRDWAEQLKAIATEVRDDALRDAASAAATSADASVSLYDSTFGPGGPAAPREISYRPGLDAGAFLAQLNAIYKAFGYRPSHDEPPDHVAVQAGFVSYLHLKRLFALNRGNEEQLTVSAEAVQMFTRDHLSIYATQLANSLQHSGIEYLASAAKALAQRCDAPRRAGTSLPPGLPLPVIEGAENEFDSAEQPTCGRL